jgi:ergothioneine biosynthesis protein EgtB
LATVTNPIRQQAGPPPEAVALRYARTRALSLSLVAPLSDADATAQSMPDASPAKWHLAHTTWFFETFVLRDHVAGYRPYDSSFAYLFNSYYEAEGARHARDRRGMLSRPRLDQVLAWRQVVDDAIDRAMPGLPAPVLDLITLGINHEQQHQELLLTDILASFAANPIDPAVWSAPRNRPVQMPAPLGWNEGRTGIVEIGDAGGCFSFDCEGPRHRILLHPHALADRPVTNAEWVGFIADGGYTRPEFWLSDGWAWVKRERIEAPLYWRRAGSGGDVADWSAFALDGLHPLHPAAPVTHISHYEADAYARWAGHGCRPRPSGRMPRAISIPPPEPSSIPRGRSARVLPPGAIRPARCSATCGNGPAARIFPIQASCPSKARSANIMASS